MRAVVRGAFGEEAAAGGLRVGIGVLTYRRPDGLRRLLRLVVDQAEALDAEAGSSTFVVVVDNDRERSGAAVVAAIGSPVRYVHEPVPGIAAGRARAVDETSGADVLVFIDDDEEPAPGWLSHLVRTWLEHGRPAGVVGRVSPTYDGVQDAFVAAGGFFVRRRHPTGAVVTAASSANLLLDRALLDELDLTFDRSLGMRGGEDTLLTRTLTARGHRLVWCDEAEVIDHIPAERMNRRWVLQRAFHHGAVHARTELALARGGTLTRAGLGLEGVGRVGAGALLAAAGRLGGDARRHARGRRLVARGRGIVVGAWGRTRSEYERPADPQVTNR